MNTYTHRNYTATVTYNDGTVLNLKVSAVILDPEVHGIGTKQFLNSTLHKRGVKRVNMNHDGQSNGPLTGYRVVNATPNAIRKAIANRNTRLTGRAAFIAAKVAERETVNA